MSNKAKESHANIALILSVLSLVAWLIPIVGVPVSITGIVFAMKAAERTRASIALGICILTLMASGVNAYVGAQRGAEVGRQIQQQLEENRL